MHETVMYKLRRGSGHATNHEKSTTGVDCCGRFVRLVVDFLDLWQNLLTRGKNVFVVDLFVVLWCVLRFVCIFVVRPGLCLWISVVRLEICLFFFVGTS